ncbi:MAG: hypothetical protein GF315_14635 [candidate division Zixibacteria bacterium]|nr:hypothetical protein [candidate division Zixibacteria bacterium]
MAEGKFGTAFNCMDGRTQLPVYKYLSEKYGLDYVDMITEPGADRALTQGSHALLESLKAKASVSVNGHGSNIIAVVGHHDCAGYPVSKDEHIAQTKVAVNVVRGWGFPAEVIGLWVDENGQVHDIDGP